MSVSYTEERKQVGDVNNFFAKNVASISGVIAEEFLYSHCVKGEPIYRSTVRVARLSGTYDFIPIMVKERMMKQFFVESAKGMFVQVSGRFCSHNAWGEDGKKHLHLYLLALNINLYQEVGDSNIIHLQGYICKPPIFRTTLFGREITDLMIAVKRNPRNNKADYIPCIAWGSNAHFAKNLEVGDEISLHGRIQSRNYFKRYSLYLEDGEWRTVHEVSIFDFDD